MVARFGPPDADMPDGVGIHTPGSTDDPPRSSTYRTLLYEQLSQTVDLYFTDDGPERGVRTMLQGKHVGDGLKKG